ncbi:MAG: hypothetical protein AMJ84_06445 [Acidithiobacillales bacterium SM23_46]|nr:MAG: hypothetical protein AMJ84_06445 [Acidithiobacillales bacterium SM23_46]
MVKALIGPDRSWFVIRFQITGGKSGDSRLPGGIGVTSDARVWYSGQQSGAGRRATTGCPGT